MKLKKACEIALECNLATVGEAVFNIRCHAVSLFSNDEIQEELAELEREAEPFSKEMKVADLLAAFALEKTVYVIIHSCADAEKGEFPAPYQVGGFFNQDRAREELKRLFEEEKDNMEFPYDEEDYREEYSDDYWEAYAEGYAAGWYTRYEIATVECEAGA